MCIASLFSSAPFCVCATSAANTSAEGRPQNRCSGSKNDHLSFPDSRSDRSDSKSARSDPAGGDHGSFALVCADCRCPWPDGFTIGPDPGPLYCRISDCPRLPIDSDRDLETLSCSESLSTMQGKSRRGLSGSCRKLDQKRSVEHCHRAFLDFSWYSGFILSPGNDRRNHYRNRFYCVAMDVILWIIYLRRDSFIENGQQ